MSKRYKKFALIGTSCVGKTTLVYQLGKKLQQSYKDKKISTVEEAARIFYKNHRTIKPFSFTNQSKIQVLAKKLEKIAESENAEIILCDRSVLDAVAYIKTVGEKKDVEKLLQRAEKWLGTYYHFFLLDPMGIEYKNDLIRKEESELRNAFHLSFVDILSNLKLPHTLISGDKKQRINKMTTIITKSL